MNPEQNYNQLLAQKLLDEFQKRNFEGYYCETKSAAREKALELIPKDALISCGGSQTLADIGLIDALKSGGYNFMDPNDANGSGEKEKIAHQALSADYFLMSANAISESGELVNADGIGNRAAALLFGPKNVLVVAGLNKVTPSLEMALLRVKKFAARMIWLKFTQDYSSFAEVDSLAEQAASHMVVTRKSVYPGRIKIILVGENVGY